MESLPHDPLESVRYLDANDLLDPMLLESCIQSAEAWPGLPDRLARTLRTNPLEVHTSGLLAIEEVMGTAITSVKPQILASTVLRYNYAIRGNYAWGPNQRLAQPPSTVVRGEGDDNYATLKNHVDAMKKRVDQDSTQRLTLNFITQQARVNYHEVLRNTHTASNLEWIRVDMETLFPERSWPEAATVSVDPDEVVERLARMGGLDYSEEGLDARFHDAAGWLQLEMMQLFMEAVHCLGSTPSTAREADMLIKAAKRKLWEDDTELKQTLLEGAREVFRRLEEQHDQKDNLKADFYMLWGVSIDRLISSVEDILDTFEVVYRTLEIEAPPDIVQFRRKYAAEPTAEVKPELSREALLAELLPARDELHGLIQSFGGEWQVSNRTLKSPGQGYAQLWRALIGSERAVNKQGITRDQASTIMGILIHLNDLARDQSASDAREQLDDQQETQDILIEWADTLRRTAVDRKVTSAELALPTTFDLKKHVKLIEQSWDTYLEAAVQELWPHESHAVATRIRAVLKNEQAPDEQQSDAPPERSLGQQVLKQNVAKAIALSQAVEQAPYEPEQLFGWGGIGRYLEEVVLPPNPSPADMQVLLENVAKKYPKLPQTIQWERLYDLVGICELFGGTLYRSKSRAEQAADDEIDDATGFLSDTWPYFVVVFKREGRIFAIAESPIHGNATYLVPEESVPGNWRDVLTLSKRDAEQVGARRIIHSTLAPHGRVHVRKVLNVVLNPPPALN